MYPVINIKNKVWHNKEGQLHRTDGPAIEYPNGDKVWLLKGKLHRADGPAIDWANGYKEWFLNGVRHRTDGPAVESINGCKEWFLNGEQLTKKLFLKLTKGPIKKLPLSERIKQEP